jgi:hypothetical protein
MERIELTQGKYALVDDADYPRLNKLKWYAKKHGRTFYAAREFAGREVKMHRYILGIDKYTDSEIDHGDHDGLNNQRYNLVICTHLQNCSNRSPYGKSKYLGVYIDKGKYIRAEVHHDGKRYGLGSFKTEEAAAVAYDKRASELKGEFANLNFKRNGNQKFEDF